MAHKKGLGSSRNGRDSNAKRLGVKLFAGQAVTGGGIIVRQRGQLSVASDDSVWPSAGTNRRPSASATLRLHSGQRSSPRSSSAWVACRSAKPTRFFMSNKHIKRCRRAKLGR